MIKDIFISLSDTLPQIRTGHLSDTRQKSERDVSISETQTAVSPVWHITEMKLSVFELLSVKIA
jgi:hypothetical protein